MCLTDYLFQCFYATSVAFVFNDIRVLILLSGKKIKFTLCEEIVSTNCNLCSRLDLNSSADRRYIQCLFNDIGCAEKTESIIKHITLLCCLFHIVHQRLLPTNKDPVSNRSCSPRQRPRPPCRSSNRCAG